MTLGGVDLPVFADASFCHLHTRSEADMPYPAELAVALSPRVQVAWRQLDMLAA